MSTITRTQRNEFYDDVFADAKREGPDQQKALMRELGLTDLFYLLVRLLNRKDLDRDWLFDRCMEVQRKPNGYLDLWAREHYKSTIITFGLTIQDLLNDPELTIGIFSFTRPIAKTFLRQIKTEFETNRALIDLYPDILWTNPQKQAPKWAEDDGLVLRRKGNPKESSLEAWGLIDSLPTSRHFQIRVYDDVITEKHVRSAEMILKAIDSWGQSLNLGSAAPMKRYREINVERYAGTRYHQNDPYREIMKRAAAIPRIHKGTKDGKPEGEPVLWSREFMAKKRITMGPYIFGCQILQDPVADQVQGFRLEWLRYWTPEKWAAMNRYILVDPAGEKKKDNDYTVMLVIGTGADRNYYLIDGIRDRLNLTERAKHLMRLHRKYLPIRVGYEKYGKDSDIEHIQFVQGLEAYHFEIVPLAGQMAKNDRIRRLIPIYEQARFLLPHACHFADYEGKLHNLTQEFIDDEYLTFPVASHDDIFDCMARILDEELAATFPLAFPPEAYWDDEPKKLFWRD